MGIFQADEQANEKLKKSSSLNAKEENQTKPKRYLYNLRRLPPLSRVLLAFDCWLGPEKCLHKKVQ